MPVPASRRSTAAAPQSQSLAACLAEIRQRPDFPAFAEQISRIMRALEDEETSLRRLTALILRDYSLTLKILRTANSAHYNRSGKPILSVSHAVALLGTEAIRHLAGGLLLFEHFHKQSPGLKQLMLLALLTAAQARELAARVGYPRREEAYICGMLHNLGEILTACYLPARYASILLLMRERRLSESEAVLRVLGFTYAELAQAVSREWNLPERVIETLQPSGNLRVPGAGTQLATITWFSYALTQAVHRSEPETGRARLRRLTAEYGARLGLGAEDIRGIVEAGLMETRETFSLLRVPLDELRLQKQTEAVLENLGKLPETPWGLPGFPACGQSALEELGREIEWVLGGADGVDLNKVLLMILEAMYRSEAFDRVLFCLLDPETETLYGRLGLGEGADALRARFRLAILGAAGPLAAALLNRRSLILSAETASAEEAQILRRHGVACLALFPIVVDEVLVGCLYGERSGPGRDPDTKTFELLSRLRHLAGRAIALSRQESRDRFRACPENSVRI
ncbi:MAG: HDOD domain-containing protein [Bryobacteraceae bacterium]|nr:HDOD domain-containing protein [Bryobacteraceae bacterium]